MSELCLGIINETSQWHCHSSLHRLDDSVYGINPLTHLFVLFFCIPFLKRFPSFLFKAMLCLAELQSFTCLMQMQLFPTLNHQNASVQLAFVSIILLELLIRRVKKEAREGVISNHYLDGCQIYLQGL